MSKIEINKDLCIGCGACCAIAEENFEIGDEGLAEVVNDKITDEAIIASESCPTSAITIEKN